MIGLKGRPSFYNVRSIDEYERFKHFESNYSERELQILRLISEGISNEIIGAKLNISVGTVRTHRKNILAKSSATNSVQAVADAIRNNLI